jgi:uncharacterized membrane protein YbaN (DUF454 family)
LALLFVALGVVGALLPGLPTTVFLLLAAWASGHGWPAFNGWLLNHPRLGPPVLRWQRYRAVPRRAKYLAGMTMAVSGVLIGASASALWVKWALCSTMLCVFVWLCCRPEISPNAPVQAKPPPRR